MLCNLKFQLASNYALVIEAFGKWGVEYFPISASFHVFVRLTKTTLTWEGVHLVLERLLSAGIMILPAKDVVGLDGRDGWFRMSFCISEEKLKEGLARIGKTLGLAD